MQYPVLSVGGRGKSCPDLLESGRLENAQPGDDLRQLPATDLIQRCISRQNEPAWHEFVRRSQPMIAAVVARTARRWDFPGDGLVDDLVQNTYLKLFANNSRALRDFDFRHESALFGFLKVVASNVVHDHFRGSRSQKRGSGKTEEDVEKLRIGISGGDNFAGKIEIRILMRQINQCLKGHPEEPCTARDRRIFWLYYREGLTAREISELPGMRLTVKGVESTVLRMTRLLRGKMRGRNRVVGSERVN